MNVRSLKYIKDNHRYLITSELSQIHNISKYGYQCDKGWYKHINKLIDDIVEVDRKQEVRIQQIKEKFGSLRFYYMCTNDNVKNHVDILIYNCQRELLTICETCGSKKGKQTIIKNRKRILCDKCK